MPDDGSSPEQDSPDRSGPSASDQPGTGDQSGATDQPDPGGPGDPVDPGTDPVDPGTDPSDPGTSGTGDTGTGTGDTASTDPSAEQSEQAPSPEVDTSQASLGSLPADAVAFNDFDTSWAPAGSNTDNSKTGVA